MDRPEKMRCTAIKAADGERCRAFAVRGKKVCAGHDPECARRSREAKHEAKHGLESLPELTTPEDAERWIAQVGRLLAAKRIKPVQARELRMIAKDWAAVHAGRLAAQEFERLRSRVAELEGQREPWK